MRSAVYCWPFPQGQVLPKLHAGDLFYLIGMTAAAGARHKAGVIPFIKYAEKDLSVFPYAINDGLDDVSDSGSEYSEAPSIHEIGTFEVEKIVRVRPSDHGDDTIFKECWMNFDNRRIAEGQLQSHSVADLLAPSMTE